MFIFCLISKYKRLTFVCMPWHFCTKSGLPKKKWELWDKPVFKETYPWNMSKPINAVFGVKCVWSCACWLLCPQFKWGRSYTSRYLRTNDKSWFPNYVIHPLKKKIHFQTQQDFKKATFYFSLENQNQIVVSALSISHF